MTFDDVLPTTARVCEAAPGFDQIARCAVVRDLRGHVRLVIDRGVMGGAFDVEALATSLDAELGKWFVGPVYSMNDAQERGRLARMVFDKAGPWTPTWKDAATDSIMSGRAGIWRLLERRLSKEEWLSSAGGTSDPPWPLREKTPGIVTFYSFKGGVGRTTSLVSCAWQFARQGKRVVVIDLDLEAPGLGSLLDAETDRGVLDFVVDHLATGSTSLHGLSGAARALGSADAERVTVLPAGKLGVSFLEKLGRLDFAGSDPWKTAQRSPVEQALEALLAAVRREFKPDYILIDSRAGLHDLAGLSLHRLAHVDVLVGRASGQGYDGLDLTIEALAARKGAARMSTVVLHTMTPEDQTSAEGAAEVAAFRERSWLAFDRCVYRGAISKGTVDAHYIPIAVPFDSALTRFQSIAGVERAFFGPKYESLRARIETLCAPEEAS